MPNAVSQALEHMIDYTGSLWSLEIALDGAIVLLTPES